MSRKTNLEDLVEEYRRSMGLSCFFMGRANEYEEYLLYRIEKLEEKIESLGGGREMQI